MGFKGLCILLRILLLQLLLVLLLLLILLLLLLRFLLLLLFLLLMLLLLELIETMTIRREGYGAKLAHLRTKVDYCASLEYNWTF